MIVNHKFTFEVTPQDVDFTRRITAIALGNYILNTAGMVATQNNLGWKELLENNLCWVLSRFAVEVKSYPAQNEKFSIETWVEDYGKIFTVRNFKIFDKDENLVGAASSIWAIIDLHTRQSYNLQQKIEYSMPATGVDAGIERAAKVKAVSPETEPVASHYVAYSDIDFNQHANSMKYLQWLADTFDLAQFEKKTISRFDANYIQEARFGEKTAIFTENDDDKTFCEVRNAENKTICRIRLIWK
jgi:acyl-ACP thioesterase